jgi:2,3,4,5-tetrahydropyridine-2-carboxylate N-succinyltransferase
MEIKDLITKIDDLYTKTVYQEEDYVFFEEFKSMINKGQIRVAERINEKWEVNTWFKKGILLGFKMGKIVTVGDSEWGFTDKDSFETRKFSLEDKVRLVPGGSSVRSGSYIGKGVTIMPPSYINVGSFIDDDTMIDSHALVGSCAQIGKRVHLSAGSMIGGVLEPINANPVIIEDDVFIGGNCGIYEGVIIKEYAVLAAGVILTAGTPVYDLTIGDFLIKDENQPLTIPQNAVVVAGSRNIKNNDDISIYCPIIIKYRDSKTEKSVKLEDLLR